MVTEDDDTRPWLLRREWADGRVTSREGRRGLIELGIATIILAFSVPVILLKRDGLPNVVSFGLYGFACIGTLVGLRAGIRIIARAWFGTSWIELPQVPLSMGRQHDAVLHIPRRFFAPRGMRLIVTHSEVQTREVGDERRQEEIIRWQDVQVLCPDELRQDAEETRVVVYLDLPRGYADSSPQRRGDRSIWRVEAMASLFGFDYVARFEVPVFRTEPDSDRQAPEPRRRSPDNRDLLRIARFRIEDTEAGIRASQPHIPSPSMAVGLGFANFFIWGAAIGLREFDALLVFPIVFGLVGVLFSLAFLDCLIGRAKLEVREGEFHYSSGLPWIGPSGTLSAEQFTQLRIAPGDRIGTQLLFHLELPRHGLSRKPLRLLSSLPDRVTAEALRSELDSALRGVA